MPHSQNNDDFLNLQNEIKDIIKDIVYEYLDNVFITNYIDYYISKKNISIKKMIIKGQTMGLRTSPKTISNYLNNYSNSIPKWETIKDISLLLELDKNEERILFLSYYNTLSKEKKSNNNSCLDLIYHVFSNSKRKYEIIPSVIKKYPSITQRELANFLNVDTKTIQRKFKELRIKNIGATKRPYWIVEE